MKLSRGRSRTAATIGIVAAIGAVAVAVAVGHAGLSNTVVSTALRSQGYRLAGGSTHLGLSSLSGDHVVVQTLRGEPFLSIAHLRVGYDLGSLAKGQPHAFGLTSLLLDHPVLTLLRRADGSWNLPTVSGAAPSSGGPAALPSHLVAGLSVKEGTIIVDQPAVHAKTSRLLRAEHIDVDAELDSEKLSEYHASLDVLGAPVRGDGSIDATRGIARHHWTMRDLPLAPPLNAEIDNDAFVTLGGSVRSADITAYGFAAPGTPVLGTHVGGSARLEDFSAAVGGLNAPIRGLGGSLDVTENGFTTAGLHGSIAGVPAVLRGGLFALGDPQLRFRATVTGDAHELRALFGFSHDLPLRGVVDATVLLQGPASDPLVLARLAQSRVAYQDIPITLGGAQVAYHDSAVALAPVDVGYGPIDARAAGTIAIGDHVVPTIVVAATAPSGSLPYLQSFVPSGTTVATVVLGGRDAALDGRFYARTDDASQAVQVLGHVDGKGQGIIAPLVLTEDGRSRILAGVALARP